MYIHVRVPHLPKPAKPSGANSPNMPPRSSFHNAMWPYSALWASRGPRASSRPSSEPGNPSGAHGPENASQQLSRSNEDRGAGQHKGKFAFSGVSHRNALHTKNPSQANIDWARNKKQWLNIKRKKKDTHMDAYP